MRDRDRAKLAPGGAALYVRSVTYIMSSVSECGTVPTSLPLRATVCRMVFVSPTLRGHT